MRFMMLMIPGGYEDAEPGTVPDAEAVKAMMAYNEELEKAGVLLALDGLHPPSMGARVSFAGGEPTVTDGPFAEAKEVVGSYFIIEADDLEHAVEIASLHPAARIGQEIGFSVEVRPIERVWVEAGAYVPSAEES